jgi:hypothetical protein
LRESGEEIERDDNERSIGLFVLFRVGLELLVLSESRVDDRQTSLVDGLGVLGKGSRSGDRYRRQTLGVSLLYISSGMSLPRAEERDPDPDHLA